MDVLMIGGTRDFGKISVRLLLERGDNVTVYSRGNARPEFWDEVDHIVGDRTDHDQFVENLKGKHFDAVIDNVAYQVEDVKAAVKALKGRTGKYLVSSTGRDPTVKVHVLVEVLDCLIPSRSHSRQKNHHRSRWHTLPPLRYTWVVAFVNFQLVGFLENFLLHQNTCRRVLQGSHLPPLPVTVSWVVAAVSARNLL